MENQQVASFTPVTVTAETLQTLAKQPNYAELLALYMAFVEITTWQNNKAVHATRSFMKTRLGWGTNKYAEHKATLIELGLIQNVTRRDADTKKVISHYVRVMFVVNEEITPTAIEETTKEEKTTCPVTLQLAVGTPSTSNLKTSTNKVKTISEVQKKELLAIVNEVTSRNFRVLPRGAAATLKEFTLQEIKDALLTLSRDEWHSPRLKSLKLDYLLRSTTIDSFLTGEKEKGIEWD